MSNVTKVQAILPLQSTKLPRSTPSQRLRNRMLHTPAVLFGASITLVLVLVAIGAPILAPYDPIHQDYNAIALPPSLAHPLGTDNLGRDILSRLIYGTRISLQVGMLSVGISTGLGIVMGLLAGYYGGWIDDVIMRVADAMMAFPALLLVLAIASALGPSIVNATIAIGVVASPFFARLLRGQVLSVRESDYVTAAVAMGCRPARLMLRHILPNTLAPLIVMASLSTANAIMTEATLSFLGVGTPPPTPSWGSMLQVGFQYLLLTPWLSFFPGMAIFITVLAFNILGDGLRSVLDPRMPR